MTAVQGTVTNTCPCRGGSTQQYYDLGSVKSNMSINDQRIPTPTQVRLAEKQIKVPFPAEHPYQSHISRLAVFPSFSSPDDPDTGVRAASQLPLGPHIPASNHDVTVLSKTKGGPYRFERTEIPTDSEKRALHWPGQYGYYNFPKSAEGFVQVFYPKPPKTVAPNPGLRPWDTTLSEKTANTLRNLERSYWLTSYQLHYTGSGPMNPVQLDDYHARVIAAVSGELTPCSPRLREWSHPAFSPPCPLEGRYARIRQGRRPLASPLPGLQSGRPCAPNLPAPQDQHKGHRAYTPNPPASQDQHEGHWACAPDPPASQDQHEGHWACAPDPPAPQDQHECDGRAAFLRPHGGASPCEACGCGSPASCLQEQEPGRDSGDPGGPLAETGITGKITDTAQALALHARQLVPPLPGQEGPAEAPRDLRYEDLPGSRKQDYKAGNNPFSLSRPQPQPTEPPGAAPEHDRGGWDTPLGASRLLLGPGGRAAPGTLWPSHGPARPRAGLLELQGSFSRYEAHRRLHASIAGSPVDLRDSVCTGRRHRFFGFNSYYFHN
nr:PREDICTED: uncharacterized protein C7orf31 homolog isoform X2 [Lepisosteus oculatus]